MKPKYGTWIKLKKLLFFDFIFVLIVAFAVYINNIFAKIILFLLAILFGYIGVILTLCFYYFSLKGYQDKIHKLIVDKIRFSNDILILDVGAGSGSLSIKTAKKNNQFMVKAIDYWGNDWGYSKEQCINNATIENVKEQIEFINASASKLPFDNELFDIIISCLTFHEVKDTDDKSVVIAESLRVLKNGGQFIFFDLFYNKKIFGEFNSLIEKMKKQNIEILEITPMNVLFNKCPKLLLHKKVLGHGALIMGQKIPLRELK